MNGFCFYRFTGVNESISMTRTTMVESANGMNGQGELQEFSRNDQS